MKKYTALSTGLILFSFSLICYSAPDKKPVVQVKSVVISDSYESLVYPARVEAKVSATILAEVEGVVRDVVPLGTQVKKGQKLFKVQQLDPVYQYSAAKITAPVNGVVSEVVVNLGTQVSRGQKMAVVVDPSQVRVTVEIPGSDLLKINKNAKIDFIASQSESPVKIDIEGISPLISNITGTATANFSFNKKNQIVSVGSIGKVVISIKGESTIKISEQAIVYRGADPFVRVVQEGIAKYKPVVLGSRAEGQIEIKKGLAVNEKIIERASQFVQDNKAVEIEKN